MAVRLSCPQGHQWDSQTDPVSGARETCPQCGAVNTTVATDADPWRTVAYKAEITATEPAQAAKFPIFPGYEILSELGRGGMGVVYCARQLSLQRLVALKVILSGGHAGAQQLARFHSEAEAVAHLQHPNIVQIHEVGEHDGAPFYAMELVEGGSLEKRLKGTPLTPTAAAELTATLARAMHFIHERSIVHRDLKPANILLASHESKVESDEPKVRSRLSTLELRHWTPKITDFGLAKRLGEDSGQTRTGAVLGTPSYMAPEQADGKGNVGPAADVYALGAMLYELLTGRPPFRAASAMETVRQVVADEPVPPTRLQPKLPRDLETICLRCLQKSPLRRYVSALALAEDLERFGRGEPVLARPVGRVERAWKWAQRRPAAAALIGVTGAAAVILLGIGIAAYVQVRHERDLAEQQRQAAQRSSARSLQAVGQIIEVAQNRLRHVPRLEQHRRAMLAEALKLYDDLLLEDPRNVEVRRDAGRAYQFYGDVQEMLGAVDEAESHWRRSLALRQGLVDEFPHESTHQHELAKGIKRIGWLHHKAGRYPEAERTYRDALVILERLPLNDAQERKDLAACHYELAITLWSTSRHAESEKHHRQGQDIWKQLAAEYPKVADYWDDLGASHLSLGSVLRDLGRLPEADAAYQEALVCKQRVADQDYQGRPTFRLEVARIHSSRAALLMQLGKPAEAETAYLEGIAVQKKLSEDFPTAPLYRLDLANNHFRVAALYRETQRADKAAAALETARQLLQRLAEDFARHVEYQSELARAHDRLGDLHAQTGRLAEAEQAYQNAAAQWAKLARHHPGTAGYGQSQATAEANRGDVLRVLGRGADAAAANGRGLELRQALVRDFPAVAAYQSELADSHDALGILAQERFAEAEKSHRQALAIREKLAKEHPDEPQFRNGLAHSKHSLGQRLQDHGQLPEAEKLFRAALPVFADLAAKCPADPSYRRNQSVACNSLANLIRYTGGQEEAETLLQQARSLREQLVRDFPQTPYYRQLLAHNHYNEGGLLLESGKTKPAEQPLRQAIALLEQLGKEFPEQNEYRHDLAAAFNSLGNMHRAARDSKEAEAAWRKCIAVQEELVKAAPDSARFRYELAVSHSNLGMLLCYNLNRLEDAARTCAAGRTLLEELVRQSPETPTYRDLLGRTMHTLGATAFQQQQWRAARDCYVEAIAQHQTLLKMQPTYVPYQQSLRDHYLDLADVLFQLADVSAAALLADDLARLTPAGWQDRVAAARLLARCAVMATLDKALTQAERSVRALEYTDRAVQHLQDAQAKGWKDRKELKEHVFAPLRTHKDFDKLLQE